MLCATFACSESGGPPRADGVANAGTGGTPAGDGGLPNGPSGEPDFEVPAGVITVETWFDWGETELYAIFADAPPLRLHRESARIGQCRLMEPYEPSSCTPQCASTGACIEAQCRPYPTRIDRGPINWTWPEGQQTATASSVVRYRAVGAAREPGEVVVQVAGLTLRAPSDHPPAADTDWAAAIATRAVGADVSLRWTNPRPNARIRLHMTDCVGSHGGLAAVEIECQSADTGVLVLPGTFLDRLDAGDWSRGECGSNELERYYIDTADGDDTFRFETIASTGFLYRGR